MRGSLAVCAAAAALGLLPTSAGASLKAIWGPNELPNGRSAFPTYKRLGVDVLQDQLRWDRIATRRPEDPRDPADPAYAWPRQIDVAYRRGERHGVRLALMVKGTPGWANGNAPQNFAPYAAGDYADFLVAASRRYRRVRHWMIWGEPSQAHNFYPQERNSPVGPRAYAILLDHAYGALKRTNPHDIVIGGMTWTFGGDVRPTDFVRWMRLPDGRPPRLDWFGHNPFSVRFPNLRKRPYVKGLRDMSDIDTFIREVRRAYRPRGIRPRLWLSEFTVSSGRKNAAFDFFVSRRKQARWLTAAYRIARRNGYVAGLGWFGLLDHPDRKNGHTTGLLTRTGKRKPAYRAYRRAR
ncbi:MAG: hypothetical protein ACRDPC_16200 [Solirubrobacteraceae bacterium]